MSFEKSIKLWASPDPEYAPTPVDRSTLEVTFRDLNVPAPQDYLDALASFGLPHMTIGLLHSIVEGDLDLADVNGFCDASAIVEATAAWRSMGLPETCVVFASDCSGNLFCFASDASGVFLFNHDDGVVENISSSFTEWIQAYCEVTCVPWDDWRCERPFPRAIPRLASPHETRLAQVRS